MRLEALPYERIRTLRMDNDLTQQEIADYLYVTQNTYSHYAVGTNKYPLDIVSKPALYYGTSVDDLLGLTDHPQLYERAKPVTRRA